MDAGDVHDGESAGVLRDLAAVTFVTEEYDEATFVERRAGEGEAHPALIGEEKKGGKYEDRTANKSRETRLTRIR